MLIWFSLAQGNNQLHREAKKCPLFYFCSLVYISSTFLKGSLLTTKGHISESFEWLCRHLWSSDVLLTLLVLSPMPTTIMGITFVLLHPASFGISLTRSDLIFFYFLILFCSHPSLPSSGIAMSIIW